MQEIFARTSVFLREMYFENRKLNNFSYLDENYRHSKFVKNMAKPGEEFINPEMTRTTSPLDILKMFGLNPPTDIQCNMDIMGKKGDIGGYTKNKRFLSDKIALKYSKILFRVKGKAFDTLVAELTKLIENPKTPFRDKIKLALDNYISN